VTGPGVVGERSGHSDRVDPDAIGFEDGSALAKALRDQCDKLDLCEHAEDVRQFVIDGQRLELVVEFPRIVRRKWLS
jgi:hypothetical protein